MQICPVHREDGFTLSRSATPGEPDFDLTAVKIAKSGAVDPDVGWNP